MAKSFLELGLKNELVEGLKKVSITEPTEIQEKVIPIALEKKNIIGQSETGSGKTLAYLLPIFEKMALDKGVQAIILAPTHELASQIKSETELLAKNSTLPVTFALIIGDVDIKRQIDKLKTKPHVIVGSAGRILELIEKKKINTQSIKTLVIDEADRLLDKKNIAPVKKIALLTNKEKQTMLISASISTHIIDLAKEFTTDLEIVKVEANNKVPENISHSYFITEKRNNRIELLRRLINFLKPEKALVFIKNSEDMRKLIEETKYHGLKAGGLFGAQEKEDRKRILDNFRKGTLQILFATDIAARGLDIKGITHVFNFDFPEDSKSYLHRCGRTGRQNNKGTAVSMITNEEKSLLTKIAKDLKITISEGHF